MGCQASSESDDEGIDVIAPSRARSSRRFTPSATAQCGNIGNNADAKIPLKQSSGLPKHTQPSHLEPRPEPTKSSTTSVETGGAVPKKSGSGNKLKLRISIRRSQDPGPFHVQGSGDSFSSSQTFSPHDTQHTIDEREPEEGSSDNGKSDWITRVRGLSQRAKSLPRSALQPMCPNTGRVDLEAYRKLLSPLSTGIASSEDHDHPHAVLCSDDDDEGDDRTSQQQQKHHYARRYGGAPTEDDDGLGATLSDAASEVVPILKKNSAYDENMASATADDDGLIGSRLCGQDSLSNTLNEVTSSLQGIGAPRVSFAKTVTTA